jgi:hypothetical protein
MAEVVHYFEVFDRIKVSGGQITRAAEVRVLCGAEDGEADNREREVTCPRCLEKLPQR